MTTTAANVTSDPEDRDLVQLLIRVEVDRREGGTGSRGAYFHIGDRASERECAPADAECLREFLRSDGGAAVVVARVGGSGALVVIVGRRHHHGACAPRIGVGEGNAALVRRGDRERGPARG